METNLTFKEQLILIIFKEFVSRNINQTPFKELYNKAVESVEGFDIKNPPCRLVD